VRPDARDNLTHVEPAPSLDRAAKHADERERLYRAGWVVLRRNGYANAGITDILTEARLGTRAFYRHFTSKDELLVSMFADNAAATARRLAERVEAAGAPLDRLDAWIDGILALGDDPRHGEAARMFISPTMPGVFDKAGDEAIAALRAPLHEALVDGAASGDFPDCVPDADATTIHAIVWQLFTDAIHGGATMSRDDARAHVARFALPALGVAGTPPNATTALDRGEQINHR
jgi:AcrR family transcriptional regulator